jgi:hypothetical protein
MRNPAPKTSDNKLKNDRKISAKEGRKIFLRLYMSNNINNIMSAKNILEKYRQTWWQAPVLCLRAGFGWRRHPTLSQRQEQITV